MYKSKRINKDYFLIVFLLLISVFPAYSHIFNHKTSSMLLFSLLLMFVLMSKPQFSLKLDITGFFIFLWIIFRIIAYSSNLEFINAVVFIIEISSIYMVVARFVVNADRLLRLLHYIVVISFGVSVLGVIEGLTGFNIFLYLDDGSTVVRNLARLGIVRIIGFTAQTAHYALYLSIVSFIAIYLIDIETSRKKIRFYKITFLLLVINILFTLTRAAVLCFLIGIILVFIKKGLGKTISIILAFMAIVFAISVFFEHSFVAQFFYMMLAIFNPDYAGKLAAGSLNEYANGIGDRLNLYKWVYETVKDNILFGMGEKAQFSYVHRIDMLTFSYYETKQSIEVNYLYILFHYGVISLVTEVMWNIRILRKSIKNSLRRKFEFEKKITFNYLIFVIVCVNLISWFTVSQGEEDILVYILMVAWMCYNSILKKEVYKRRPAMKSQAFD